jgi:hypothetical protein
MSEPVNKFVPSTYSVRLVNIELVLGPIHHGQHDDHDT